MFLKILGYDFKCNECGIDSKYNSNTYFCKKCDFNICDKCVASKFTKEKSYIKNEIEYIIFNVKSFDNYCEYCQVLKIAG
jgi:hypothetical protein